ncbi:carbohydrate-binding family 9-like protein [Parapedobacter defluvii]|uniref:carbohydrate-binding family 9-like protein n=1 Tax=Parapedobacter defluvii TaxID=2045106 RepID=UPI0033416BEB
MMYKSLLIIVSSLITACSNRESNGDGENKSAVYHVQKAADFQVTGDGSNENWGKAEWIVLAKREQFKDNPLQTNVKALYSETGLYFLFSCQDNKLTSSMNADFMDLWKEDVAEVFLWPDENYPTYFEYEISPLNHELPILVANTNGDLLRWQPFHYDADRQTDHETAALGGEKKPGAAVDGWVAEFFIPYKLLIPLNHVPPHKGDRWRANFYRVDYDEPKSVSWLWQLTKNTFHDYESFGSIIFN